MRFQARVRATVLITFDHDIPDWAEDRGNQAEVLTARAGAAHAAEAAAQEAFPNAIELLVEEVTGE